MSFYPSVRKHMGCSCRVCAEKDWADQHKKLLERWDYWMMRGCEREANMVRRQIIEMEWRHRAELLKNQHRIIRLDGLVDPLFPGW